MTRENRQFLQAMWIMAKKEFIPFILVSGAFIAGMYIMKSEKDDVNKEYKSMQNDFHKKTNVNSVLFTPLNLVKNKKVLTK